MIKQLLVVVLVIVVALCVTASRKPDAFRVERSIVIKATSARVFDLIDDFHNFGTWSPWDTLDPKMSRSITGAARGKGAAYEWSGNMKAGAGRMEITESVPASKVVMRLDFAKPIRSTNTAEYVLTPLSDSTTKVTWSMYGPSPFPSKIMQVFVTMDEMIGGDFERGLAQMKAAAER
jgi:uncharacterized protein YndB with AHSA1/START domain